MPGLQAVRRVLCPVNRALEVRYVSGHLFTAKSQLPKVETRDLKVVNAGKRAGIRGRSLSIPA